MQSTGRPRLAVNADSTSKFAKTGGLFGGDGWPPNPALIATLTGVVESAADR